MKAKVWSKSSLLLSTLFGTGYFPLCPGTAAGVLGLLVFIIIKSPLVFIAFTIFSIAVSFPVSSRAEKIFGKKDPKQIVIDDFCGMLITFIFIPHDIRFIVSGFFLFRMLDMLKIPPANIVEDFKGSLGIVGDDIVAGIYANLILQVVRFLV
ncbi:MAG: phosphatidylglycerophosphatase A [Candidatus Omnitrophica bacterium]|nr:phosphatidylglycerophosphatase A [Candidatus Omnitrophota bacterium]